jgi:hypothetical protein
LIGVREIIARRPSNFQALQDVKTLPLPAERVNASETTGLID